MSRFAGRVAVVTGAAQGIGRGTAEVFAEQGAQVAILDIQPERAAKTAEEIRAQGGEALAFPCDVTKSDQVEETFAGIAREFGRIDILVNNAGVTRDQLIFKMTDSEFDIVIDTHLKGSFYCSRAAQKYMVKQQYGKIIFVSSRASWGTPGQVNYSAAKAGMQGMTRTLAMELGKFNINVNAVCPGHTETEMVRKTAERQGLDYEEVKAQRIQRNWVKRIAQPRDIGNVIAFLASDEAIYITGQVIYAMGRGLQ